MSAPLTYNAVTLTACGLRVVSGNPREWPGFSWQQEVVDMPGDQEASDALALIAHELMAQVGRTVTTGAYGGCRDLAFATLHPMAVERVEYPGLDCADPPVSEEEVAEDPARVLQRWTVCGILEQSWRTVHYRAWAGTPLVAYFRAWDWARAFHGEYLLLAGVHEGHLPVLETFGYADPWCSDGSMMPAKAAGDWGVAV